MTMVLVGPGKFTSCRFYSNTYGFMRLLGSFEESKVGKTGVNKYPGPPFVVLPSYATIAALGAAICGVCSILRSRCETQICNSVVASDRVPMIDVVRRPYPVGNIPSDPVGLIILPLDPDDNISSNLVKASSGRSNSFESPTTFLVNFPPKLPCRRIVSKNSAQFIRRHWRWLGIVRHHVSPLARRILGVATGPVRNRVFGDQPRPPTANVSYAAYWGNRCPS